MLPSKIEKASNTVTGKGKRQKILTKMPSHYSVSATAPCYVARNIAAQGKVNNTN